MTTISKKGPAPLVSYVLPTIAGILVCTFGYVEARRSRRVASLVGWLVLPFVLLLTVALMSFAGLNADDGWQTGIFCLAALGATGGALLRGHTESALLELDSKDHHLARTSLRSATIVVLLLSTALGTLSLEIAYNPALEISLAPLLVEVALIFGVLMLLYLLFQRNSAGIATGVVMCSTIGIIQFFIIRFKGTAMLPGDVLGLPTAVTVAANYTYEFDGNVLISASVALLAIGVCALLPRSSILCPQATVRQRRVRIVANLGAAVLVLVALAIGVCVPNYAQALGLSIDYWDMLQSYRSQGLVTTFVAIAQNIPVDTSSDEVQEVVENQGQTESETNEQSKGEGEVEDEVNPDAEARALEEKLAAAYDETLGKTESRVAAVAQFDEVQPSIVVIMDETFADLSLYNGASWGYLGPAFYNSLTNTLLGGDLSVSVLGGDTCNTEFEFLTGISMAYVDGGVNPYSLYNLTETPSLAQQLSSLGYSTTAIHPNEGANWNRDQAYAELGFDEFLTIADFEDAETFHSGVTDEATFDKILEVLNKSDSPAFIFDVTMQNHSGYDQGNIDSGLLGNYELLGLDDADNAQVNEYLACIDVSDQALEDFLGKVSKLDTPVIVVFFGDHQPYLSTALNDLVFADEDTSTVDHYLRLYQTTYMVWANYDLAGNPQTATVLDTSVNYLAALVLEAIGAPLTNFQKAQLAIRSDLPSVTQIAVEDGNGQWMSRGDTESLPEAYLDLGEITYLEFSSKLR